MAGVEADARPQSVTSVLSTPELLESILLRLDLRTLLTSAQLVNRQWRALVSHSPALQRALFLQPAAAAAWAPENNPLLAAAFPAFYHWGGGGDDDEIRRATFAQQPMAARLGTFMRADAS
jgi:hypothetical protein